ncbi:MAG: type II secretion system protein [Planctomycetota bacterium]
MRREAANILVRENHIPSSGTRSSQRSQRGFSLVDLLVSLSVLAVLVAVLMPSLAAAQEAARRTKCASNIRQIGLGLQMYTYDYSGGMPQSVFRQSKMDTKDKSKTVESVESEMVHLRVAADAAALRSLGPQSANWSRWDGLGHLVKHEYLSQGRLFYCPSHRGEHRYETYQDQWFGAPGSIVSNYQYRIPTERYMSSLHPSVTLVADAMRSQEEYNHRSGNNMLKADMSVRWFEDSTGELFESLVMTGQAAADASAGVERAWAILDADTGRVPRGGSSAGSSNSGSMQGQSGNRGGRRIP